jgi:hypothetical protein
MDPGAGATRVVADAAGARAGGLLHCPIWVVAATGPSELRHFMSAWPPDKTLPRPRLLWK